MNRYKYNNNYIKPDIIFFKYRRGQRLVFGGGLDTITLTDQFSHPITGEPSWHITSDTMPTDVHSFETEENLDRSYE